MTIKMKYADFPHIRHTSGWAETIALDLGVSREVAELYLDEIPVHELSLVELPDGRTVAAAPWKLIQHVHAYYQEMGKLQPESGEEPPFPAEEA